MNTIWITGAGGFLGHEAVCAFRRRYPETAVLALQRSPAPTRSGDRGRVRMLDLTDFAAVAGAFVGDPPDAVIHLAACSDPNWCQEHPEESAAVNIGSSLHLAGLCAGRGVPLVFASTDLVFDGRQAPYREEDLPAPVSVYAAQKLMVERELARRYREVSVVVRLPLMFGGPSPSGKNPQKGILEARPGGPPVRLFVDEFRTPASTRAVAEGLILALEQRVALLHLGGPERVSRLEFGRRLLTWLGRDPAVLQSARQREVAMAAPRPPDVSLNSDRARALGFSPLPLEEEWARDGFFQALKNGPPAAAV